MRIFAISDLHLSFGVDKPMDRFGAQWVGHAAKIQRAWDERVGDDDWVMVGGDTSWGLRLAEAQPDLDWLGQRPGRKVLIRGNHCPWWESGKRGMAKVRAALHPSITPLQNNAVALDDDTVVIGTRLWDAPNPVHPDPAAERIFHRELERLRVSIAAGRELGGARWIALLHYPPRFSDGRVSDAVPLLEEAGVRVCIYGHLHGEDHRSGFQGEAGGIRYYLTSCDAIDFTPIEIPLP